LFGFDEDGVTASTDPRVGTEFLGYRIESLAGRGGMGVVYRAYDLRLKRVVAVKLIAPELSENADFRKRFLTETELAASLEHPNVVPIHDAGEVDGQLYIAMRYVEGGELKTLLQQERQLDPERAIRICGQIAAALDAAHARGLVHRDVKPSNVLLDMNEHVYLTDFGLSQRLGELESASGPELSLGTPAYAAPEQIQGGEVDGRADVYSLACVLYECLTGEAPYARDSELAVMWAHIQESPPSASELNAQLPAAVDAVIATALAKDPGERHATCGELVGAARETLGLQRPTTVRDRKALILTALGVAIAGAAAVAGVLLSQGGSRGRPSTKPTLAPSVYSVQRIDAKTNALAETIGIGQRVDALAAGGGKVWVGSVDDQSVREIDPRTNQVTDKVATTGPDSIATGFGAVFVANTDGTLLRIDPATLKFSVLRDTGSSGVAVGENGIWTVGSQGLVRVNRQGYVVTSVSPAGFSPFAVATGGGAVWVLDDKLRSLWRIDPRTDRRKRIRLGFDPGGLAFGLGRVWVTDYAHDAVAEIDPARNRIIDSIPVGDEPIGVVANAGSVWTANYGADTITRIDPRTRKVVATISVGPHPKLVAVGEGGVWVAVQAS
jgi:YVTN family beta-propeller protein